MLDPIGARTMQLTAVNALIVLQQFYFSAEPFCPGCDCHSLDHLSLANLCPLGVDGQLAEG